MISNALSCGVVALTVANMIGGILLSFIVDMFVAHNIREMGTLALIGGIVGAVAGLIVGIVLTNALDSAVAMVFVCFAEDPLALQVIFACSMFSCYLDSCFWSCAAVPLCNTRACIPVAFVKS